MPRSLHGGAHWHFGPVTCHRSGCEDRPEMMVGMGPITGLLGVAEELIRHYEIDPAEHDGLLSEVEWVIAEQMLDTMRDILTARGIPIPAEAELASVATGSSSSGGDA